MVRQRRKDILFFLARPILRFLGWAVRPAWPLLTRRRPLRLHIGCGDKYLPSFLNVDANPFRRIDLWLDLRNPLPIPTGVVEGIYALGTMEHFFPDELDRLLRECFRVLKPGGCMRIGVPHLSNAVQAYLSGRSAWFHSWPRDCQSLGGRLSNFLLCDGAHRILFDLPHLEELLKRAGFSGIQECPRGKSFWIETEVVFRVESEVDQGNPAHYLYVEARRP